MTDEQQEQVLRCRDCGCAFAWTISDQRWFAERGLTYPQKRCLPCRQAARLVKQELHDTLEFQR